MKKFISPQKLILGTAVIFMMVTVTLAVARAYHMVTENKIEFKTIEEALDRHQSPYSMVHWDLASQPQGRALGAGDAYMLGRAYTNGMETLAGAHASGIPHLLKQYFTGEAHKRASTAVTESQDDHQMIVLNANASARIFHLDGSLIQFETKGVNTARYIEKPGSDSDVILTRECQSVTMFNQTTGWRIGALSRECGEAIATEDAPALPIIHSLIGMNYYPKDTPWHDFWPKFDPIEIKRDFRKIRALGGNAVRIFLQFEPFDEAGQLERSLINLVTLLDIADDEGLTVMPTLFDLRSDYRPRSWARSYAYLNRVLRAIGTHPAVRIIDIKNEPDRDFERHGKRRVLAWLETMARTGRDIAPHIAFTVGWMEPQFAPLLQKHLGVISYHDYEDPATIGERLSQVRKAVGRKSILVTEIGWHSWQPISKIPFPSNEQKQAQIIEQQMSGLEKADGQFLWTLHDFSQVPNIVVGPLPWRKAMQKKFGLLRTDGSLKPSAKVFVDKSQSVAHPFSLPNSVSLLEKITP